jgi:release factor glutamine methyltransferase
LKAVAESLKGCRFFGIEKDAKALEWARSNLDNYDNVTLMQGDFRETPPVDGIDIIVSNPPYLSQKEFDRLPVEIKNYEPENALLAEDPMEPYRAIARFAGKALKEGGHLVLELGSEQAKRHRAFLKLSPDLELCHFRKDLGGRLRAVVFRRL